MYDLWLCVGWCMQAILSEKKQASAQAIWLFRVQVWRLLVGSGQTTVRGIMENVADAAGSGQQRQPGGPAVAREQTLERRRRHLEDTYGSCCDCVLIRSDSFLPAYVVPT